MCSVCVHDQKKEEAEETEERWRGKRTIELTVKEQRPLLPPLKTLTLMPSLCVCR